MLFVVTTPPKVILKDHTKTLIEVRPSCLGSVCCDDMFLGIFVCASA